MSHIRSICVTKKSSLIGSPPSSTGWLWVGSCISLGLPKLFLRTGWEVLTGGKGASGAWQEWWDGFGTGKSGLATPGREEGDPNSGKEQRSGRRDVPGWGLCYTFYICDQRSPPPPLDPCGQISLSSMKGNKKQITFLSRKVVLKHKSICVAKSYLPFVASLDPKLPDCGMTRRGVWEVRGVVHVSFIVHQPLCFPEGSFKKPQGLPADSR